MSIPEIRKELIEYLENADEAFLTLAYAVLQEYQKNDEIVVGSDADGMPLTQNDLLKKVLQSKKDIASERSHTSEEVIAFFKG